MSAAGLGLQLYDALLDTSVNDSFLRWIDYARKHFMGRDRKGRIGSAPRCWWPRHGHAGHDRRAGSPDARVRVEGAPSLEPVLLLHGIGRGLEDGDLQFARLL